MSELGLGGGRAPASDKGLNKPLIETLRLAWADEDLRSRLQFILMVLVIYVIGVHITVPVPGISVERLEQLLADTPFFQMLNMMGGGAFKRVSIFALGLGPYIIASIILQIFTMGNPKWKEEMKEGGEYARRQQNKRTRYLTILLCVFQGWGLIKMMNVATASLTTINLIWILLFWTAGSMFLLWLGEQISERGIGNGISVMIFTGIVIAIPGLVQTVSTSGIEIWRMLALLAVFLATTWFIVFFTVAQRRIPVQHMRRNFGTKTMGGQVSYLPVSVAMAGVIPIIFAVTLIYMPQQLAQAFPADSVAADVLSRVAMFLMPDFTRIEGYIAALFYTLLIFAFTYFWTAMQYNVDDIADNLKRGGSYIQGIRPGRQTRDFLNGVISRITFIGAIFLALAALTQYIVPLIVNIDAIGLIAGTSLMIMVSVALETMRQIEANLITKQYGG